LVRVLVPVLIANVLELENGAGRQRVLHADTVLVANRQLVIRFVEAGDASDCYGRNQRLTVAKLSARIFQLYVAEINVRAERHVRAGIIHVVALDAFIHHTETATENRLA